MNNDLKHIAIFGPTGYIGTKMVIRLYNQGYRLSLFTRNARKLNYLQEESSFLDSNETRICVVEQFLEAQYFNQISESLQGVDAIYYLVHSLNAVDGSFINKDNELADLIAKAATLAGVKQIIYLGGLGIDTIEAPLSHHLQSRQDTAEHLRTHHDNVVEFRAGVIIGAGSASFEIIRNLGTKLPFIPQLQGKEGLCQPVFVDDVILYLLHALLNDTYQNRIAEIGSDDVFRYTDMVKEFARIIYGKEMFTLPLPIINYLLVPKLIAWFAARMTSLPYVLIEPLIEGMHSQAIIRDHPVRLIEPDIPIKPVAFRDAIKIALKRIEIGHIESIWSTPYELSVFNPSTHHQFMNLTSKETEGLFYEEYAVAIDDDDMDRIFNKIKTIGGKNGYYSPLWLWKIRGFIDSLLGGPGLSDVKRHADLLRVGDKFDFWVVTFYKNTSDEKVLRLKAKMKVPGIAWFQFVLKRSKTKDTAMLNLRAYFEPSGIGGYLYWYSLYPIHKYIFKRMAENIVKQEEDES